MSGKKLYKTTVALAVSTDLALRDRLTALAERRGISRAELVNEMLINNIEKFERRAK